MVFPIDWVRAQFPGLHQLRDGRVPIFFDAPGGTQVPLRVAQAVANYLLFANANTHGAFATSQATDAVIADAHAAVADLLGCDADEVAFGQNMTSLTFALSRAIARELQPGDELVVTRLDHDANVAPWRALEQHGVLVRVCDIDIESCTLDMQQFATLIGPRTRLVAVGYASNAVGTINDLPRIVALAHAVGAWVFVDAVHYAPHGPIDVRALGCDFLACSPYKFFAPHQGAMYGRRELLRALQPYKVRPATDELPGRWMTGTQSHEAMAGTTAAIDYLAELGVQVGAPAAAPRRAQLLAAMAAIQAYERELAERLIAGLLSIPGLSFYGLREPHTFGQRTPTVSIRLAGWTPRRLAEALAEQGICAWDGNFYALGLTERLGVEVAGGLLRLGLAHYTTAAEVDTVLAALRRAATQGAQ